MKSKNYTFRNEKENLGRWGNYASDTTENANRKSIPAMAVLSSHSLGMQIFFF